MQRNALAGSNTSSMKSHNLRAVLGHLLRDGLVSRAELAQRTALSNTAISNLVADLLDQGVLSEDTPARAPGNGNGHAADPPRGLGRPRTGLRLVPSARHAVGVHIGIGILRAAVVDLHGQIVHNRITTFDTGAPAERVLGRIARLVERTIRDSEVVPSSVIGLGIGASGLVDPVTGTNVFAPNLGWRDVRIQTWMARRLNLPVVVDNNVRAMALGESMFGAGRGAETLAFVYGRVGVGAGFVVNGQLFRGSGAGAGEIGHMMLVVADRPVELEALVSERVLIRAAERLARARPKGILAAHLAAPSRTKAVERIFAAARAGDDAVGAVIDEQARYLGLALSNVVNVFNPEMILLGGMFVDGSDLLLPTAERTMRQHAFAGLGERVTLRPSSFGWRAGVIGAGALALSEFFYQVA